MQIGIKDKNPCCTFFYNIEKKKTYFGGICKISHTQKKTFNSHIAYMHMGQTRQEGENPGKEVLFFS